MNEIVYLIFRQVRTPALVLLAAYAVAIFGMIMMPGVNDEGQPAKMTIFQAFYWVSYTATTIGYGEVPFAFSEAQRMWVAFSIYYTVPSWFYAIGKLIALMQDATFQHALADMRFAQKVGRLDSRFVIVCGFGEAGKRLVKRLTDANFHCVVIDKDPSNINRMALDASLHSVFAITGDASDVELLTRAGIRSPHCRAVVAITDREDVNIKVALAAKLLSSNHPNFQIICRTYTRRGSNNAQSLDVDTIINTNRIFAERLTIGLRRPAIAALLNRLYTEPGEAREIPLQPPGGRWIICGYDSLGKTLKRFLEYEGVDSLIVDPNAPDAPGFLRGVGSEAVTLRAADIGRAQAIVAAENSDSDNLSIAMTAKAMHPSLFVIGKQNRSSNEKLFDLAGFDRVMAEAELIATQIFPRIARPLLSRFITLLRHQDEPFAKALLARIEALAGEHSPRHYILRINDKHAPAIIQELASGNLLRLQHMWMRPGEPDTLADALPLYLQRGKQEILLPNLATTLQKNDAILIVYHKPEVERRLRYACHDEGELYYAAHGKERPRSWLFNYLRNKFDT
ncbi:MAG: NAD-binding protein [Cardiobacteriaceae bacterium]|nr:NAD-binding protein [Cardiobacteriaceae bacterium]